jgi:ankyrin repeat protein
MKGRKRFRAFVRTISCLIALLFSCPVYGSPPSAPLADAAENGSVAGIQTLLACGVDINAAQPDGMTALHWAAYRDELPAMRMLVHAGANVNEYNRYGIPPLFLACGNGNADAVKLLLDAGADPNSVLNGGETALMTAARSGSHATVTALLSSGVSINARENHGQTALMWAADAGHAEVVRAIIESGADFKTPLASGFTPLFFAVREGKTEVVRILLSAGVDVNAPFKRGTETAKAPKTGTSPLLLAVENGHFELAVALLKAGADPNDQRTGYTALHALTWVRKPDTGDDGDPAPVGSGNLSSLQLARELVTHGAQVNSRSEKGYSNHPTLTTKGATPFLLAAKRDDVPLMKLLIELGADPLLPNADKSTPLMAAAGLGTTAPTEEAGTEAEAVEAVKMLLALGADVNAVDNNGETAMHGAAYKSLPKVVQLLAENGADIKIWDRINKHGWTPLSIAEGHRPGNFKPSAETIDALKHVMQEAIGSPGAAAN